MNKRIKQYLCFIFILMITLQSSVYAESNGDSETGYVETEQFAIEDMIIEDMQGLTRAGNNFIKTIASGKRYTLARVNLTQGMILTFDSTVSPSGKQVRAGYVDSNGRSTMYRGSNRINYSFQIKTTGIYAIFIENVSNSSVTVTGWYTY